KFNCHVIWMLDTCESGAAVEAGAAIGDSKDTVKAGVRNASEHGALVFAASRKVAFENQKLGGGFFSVMVREGLDGKADQPLQPTTEDDSAGIVTVKELVDYVIAEVYKATGREQEPVVTPTELQEVIAGQIKLVKVRDDAAVPTSSP